MKVKLRRVLLRNLICQSFDKLILILSADAFQQSHAKGFHDMSVALKSGLKEKVVLSLCKSKMMAWAGLNPAFMFPGSYTDTNETFMVKYFGSNYKGKIDNISNWMIYYFGDPDACVTSFVLELVNFVKYNTARPFSCYDLGANRGEFSLKVAGIADSVVAVEPSKARYAQLTENVDLSDLENIKTFNTQLGLDHQNSARLSPDMKTLDVAPQTRENAGGSDAFIEANCLEPPDLVRINAGGNCLSILHWLEPVLASAQPIILMERAAANETKGLSEAALRSALYADAKLYALLGSPRQEVFKLEKFAPNAHRIVCYPRKISRMIEQGLCKMKGIRAI